MILKVKCCKYPTTLLKIFHSSIPIKGKNMIVLVLAIPSMKIMLSAKSSSVAKKIHRTEQIQ